MCDSKSLDAVQFALFKSRLEDLKRIKSVREYYRRSFVNGDSDESFMLWVEQGLELIHKKDNILSTNKNEVKARTS